MADQAMFPFATGATAIALEKQLVGLFISNGLIVYRQPLDATSRMRRSDAIVAARWMGICQSVAVAQLTDATVIAWIDGRNQVDPTRKLGLMSVLRDQGPWPNADVYFGWLVEEPDHLRIVRPIRVTKGTPITRDLRMMQVQGGWLLFWSGKANLSPESPDQMFVARISAP